MLRRRRKCRPQVAPAGLAEPVAWTYLGGNHPGFPSDRLTAAVTALPAAGPAATGYRGHLTLSLSLSGRQRRRDAAEDPEAGRPIDRSNESGVIQGAGDWSNAEPKLRMTPITSTTNHIWN